MSYDDDFEYSYEDDDDSEDDSESYDDSYDYYEEDGGGDYEEPQEEDSWESYYLADEGEGDDDDGREQQEEQVAQAEQAEQSWEEFLAQFGEPTEARGRPPAEQTWDQYLAQYAGDPAQDQAVFAQQKTEETRVAPNEAVVTWADGSGMDEKTQKQARIYQVGLEEGLDAEGARVLVAVSETEGGLFGAIGDTNKNPLGSRGPFQFYEGGQMPAFRSWLRENNIAGDPNVLVNDVDLATRFAARTYLGRTIKLGQQQYGLHDYRLAEFVQENGQVSENPERTRESYLNLFYGRDARVAPFYDQAKGGLQDPFERALTVAVPKLGARAAANAQIPSGHWDGDGHDHGIATPYTQRQVDKSGQTWTVAFDYDQPYNNPFNPAIPNHRGVDVQMTGAAQGGMGLPYTAFRDGTVVKVTNDPHGGIGIIVDTGDPNARYDRYFHNNAVSVKEGERVTAGTTKMGVLGQTGTEGFPHLHYEVSKAIDGDPAGQTIDPRPYLGGPVGPRRPVAGDTAAAPAAPRIIPMETPYTSGNRPQTTGVVIHATHGGAATPEEEFAWTQRHFMNNPDQVSANAVIAADGTIAMPSNWDATTHHAGENNSSMFGIELARARPGMPYTDAQYASLGWLLGEVSKRYNLPLTRQSVVGHEELAQGKRSGKIDPGPEFSFDRAIASARGTPPAPQAAAAPAPAPPPARRAISADADVRRAAATPAAAAQPKALPPETERALREWQGWRASRGESQTDINEFRAHLGRLGAPDPWAADEQRNAEVTRANAENRTKFLAQLPEPTQRAYTEWEGFRKSRGEDPGDIAAFRVHLDRLGAPNPWTQQEQERARVEAHNAEVTRQNAIRAAQPAAPAPGTRNVYKAGGREISEAEYQQLQARNADIDKQNAAIGSMNAHYQQQQRAAESEQAQLREWQEADRRAGPGDYVPPRPATPNLDWVLSRQAAGQDAGVREQTAEQRVPLSVHTERLIEQPDQGPREAPRIVNQQLAQNLALQTVPEMTLPTSLAPPEPVAPGWLGAPTEPKRAQAPAEIVAERQARERGWVPPPPEAPSTDTYQEQVRAGSAGAGLRAAWDWMTTPAETPTPTGTYQEQVRAASGGEQLEQVAKPLTDAYVTLSTPEGRDRWATETGERGQANLTGIGTSTANFVATAFEGMTQAETIEPGSYRAQVRAGSVAPWTQPIQEGLNNLAHSTQEWAELTRVASEERQRQFQEAGYDIVRPPDRPLDLTDPLHLASMTVENIPILAAGVVVAAGTALTAGMLGAPLAVAGLAGSTASAALMFGVEGGQAFQTAIDQGIDKRTALQVGATVGAVNAALEEFGPLKWLPDALKKELIGGVVGRLASGPAVRWIARGIEGGTEESAEEVVQGLVSNIAEAAFDPKKKIGEGLFESAVGGFLPGAILGSTGQASRDAAGVADRFRAGREADAAIAAAEARSSLSQGATRPSLSQDLLDPLTPLLDSEGVQVRAITVPDVQDWTRYVVTQADPDDPTRDRTFVVGLFPGEGGGLIARRVSERGLDLNAPKPIAETPEARDASNQGVLTTFGYLNQKGVISDAAVLRSRQESLRLATEARQRARVGEEVETRTSFAPESGAHVQPIQEVAADSERRIILPEGWTPGTVAGTGITIYVPATTPAAHQEELLTDEAHTALAPALAALSDRVVEVGRTAGGLEPGEEQQGFALGLLSGGLGLTSDVPGVARDPATGISRTLGSTTIDIGAAYIDARKDAATRGVGHKTPAFVRIYSQKLAKAIVHETGHFINQFHGATHAESEAAFAATVMAEARGLEPIVANLQRTGGLDRLLDNYMRVLAVSSPSEYWSAYATGYLTENNISPVPVPRAPRPVPVDRSGAPGAVGEQPQVGGVLPGGGRVAGDPTRGTAAPSGTAPPTQGGVAGGLAAPLASNLPRLQRGRNAAPPGPTAAQQARAQRDAAAVQARPIGFQTARGSTYEVHPDGTTTRNKAAREDPGHEGDFGLKPQSAATYFLTPENAQRLSPPQGSSRVIDHGDGTLSLATQNANGRWGIAPSQRNVPYETTPRVGAIPLEVWQPEQVQGLPAYRTTHFGNPIVRVQEAPGPSAMQAQEPPPIIRADERIAPAVGGQLMAQAEGILQSQQGDQPIPRPTPAQPSVWDRLTARPRAAMNQALAQLWHHTQTISPTSNTISRALPSGRGVYVAEPTGVMTDMRPELQEQVDEIAANPMIQELDVVTAQMFREMEATVQTRYPGASPTSYGGIYLSPRWQAVRIQGSVGHMLGLGDRYPGQVFTNPSAILNQADQGWTELNGSLLVTDEGLEFAARHYIGIVAHEAAHSQAAVRPDTEANRSHGIAHSRLFGRIYEDVGGDYVPQIAEILKRARDNGSLEQFMPDLVPSHGNWDVAPMKPGGWPEVGFVPDYPEGHLKPVPLQRALQAGRRPTTRVASQFTQGLDLVRAPGATGEGVLPGQPVVRLDPSQVLDREPPRQPPPPVQLREEWPEAFADMVEPGRGLPVPAFVIRTPTVEVDQRVPFGVAYQRLWTPEIAANVRNNPSMQPYMGETYLKNPLLYEGADSVNDRASALMQVVGGTPEQGGALVSATQDALATYGPTTENVESILAWVGLGDPTQAPLIVKAARGNTSPGAGGLVDLMVTHMLAHEARMAGYDGHVAYQPTESGLGRLTDVGRFEAYENQVDLARGGRGEEASQYETDENGRVVYRGPAETPPGYRFEDGRPTFQGVENPYQIEGNGLVYRPDGPSAMVGQEPARLTGVPVELPSDPEFSRAVQNTDGATWTDEDGLEISLQRWQVPEQAEEISARTGVFYLPTARSRNPYRRGSQAGYGGTQRVTGSSFFRRPYAVRGATGGGAVARAYDQLVGQRGAYEAMRLDAIRSIPYAYRNVSAGEREQAIADVLERYGGDPDMAYEILQNHNRGNLTMTAIVEHVAAAELRRQGYDSMVAYSAFRGRPTISEIFDVREETYPDEEGRTELHPQYQPRWTEMAPSAMAAEEPPHLAAQRLQADLTHPELHADIAQRANAVLDGWQQDEDSYDEVFGTGGVCDAISMEIVEAIQDRYGDIDIMDGGQDGDDHAYPIAYRNGVAFVVDIPPGVYETGGGYSWQKIPGAEIRPEHIVVEEVPYEYLGVEDDAEYGPSAMEAQEPPALDQPRAQPLATEEMDDYHLVATHVRAGSAATLWRERPDLRARVEPREFTVTIEEVERSVPIDHYVPRGGGAPIPLVPKHPGQPGTANNLAYGAAMREYGGRYRFPSGYYTDRAGRRVPFDSTWEAVLMPELDRRKGQRRKQGKIKEWWSTYDSTIPDHLQKFRLISYTTTDQDGVETRHEYKPDFIVLNDDGSIEVWEVKPTAHFFWPRKEAPHGDPVVKAISAIPFLAGAEEKARYRIWTEDDIAPLVPKTRTFAQTRGFDRRDVPILDTWAPSSITDKRSDAGREIVRMLRQVTDEVLAADDTTQYPALLETARENISQYKAQQGRAVRVARSSTGPVPARPPDPRRATALALRKQGLTNPAIAAQITADTGRNVAQQTISRWLIEDEARQRRNPLRADIDAVKADIRWLAERDPTLPISVIADRVGRDESKVGKWLREMGLPRIRPDVVARQAREAAPDPKQMAWINGYLNGATLTETAAQADRSLATVSKFMLSKGVPERTGGGQRPGTKSYFDPVTNSWDVRPADEIVEPRQFWYDPGTNAETKRWREVSDRTQSLGLNPAIWTAQPQAIKSSDTTRPQKPALMDQIPWQRGTLNFDLGGGKYENATIDLAGKRVKNVVYDPSFQSEEVRVATLRHVREYGGADTVTVANVLNVIAEPEVRQQVIQQARDILRPGGTAYFSVWPGDPRYRGQPRQTTDDGWQENRPLASYLDEIQQEFPGARKVGDRIEASSPALAPVGQGPSAMAAQEPANLNIPGVTTSRATMRRESAAEDKIVESNKQIITESYSGNIAHIIGKELVQNGVDAQRESPGAVMKVAYFTNDRRIWAIDQGTGMPASVVENEFTEYQGTKKSAGASGGKGTAKTAILGRNDRVEVRTVARIDPREERAAERAAPRKLTADAERADTITFDISSSLLELFDDGGYQAYWSGRVGPDQMDMILGPELAQSVLQTTNTGGLFTLYGEDLVRAKEVAVAPRVPKLPDAVERGTVISFETAGRDQLIVTDADGNYLIDEGGVTLPRMYELLGEDVAEAVLAQPDDGIGYRELLGNQLESAKQTARERLADEQAMEEDEDVGEPYYEETILWGNSDDYLRPSKGLQTATGPFGWVDEAIGRGELQDILTDPMTRTPWDQQRMERQRDIEVEIADIEANTSGSYGRTQAQEARYQALGDELYELERGMGEPRTGTRISLVLEQDAAWPAPSHSAEYPTAVEKYMNEHIASNRVEGQTVQFVLDGVEYQGQPLNPKQVANTFVKTLTSDTWEIDLYASDEVQEQGSIQVDVQNNGLYQLSIRPYLNRPAVLPTRISANIRSKVGAKARGYPWSSDRTRLIAGAEEAIEEYVQGDLMNEVIAQEIAARQAALRDAIPLPDGDGKLFNVGRVEGQELADLQDLAKRPYLATLNRHLTELHNRLSAMLDGHTWAYSNGATFERSSFGGFGLSSGWQGLNSTITSFDTEYNTPHLLLYDPWQLLMTAAIHARDQDVALANAIEGEVVAAESRPERRSIDITDALLAWDPNEERRIVWTDPETGNTTGATVTPQRMMADLRTYQRLVNEQSTRSGGPVSPWMLQHGRAYIEGVQPTADAYLEQLTHWLVAQAVESGENLELVDPADPITRPRDPSSEAALNYYTNVPYSSTDALYRRIPADERGVAEATDSEDRQYAQDRLDRAQRQYEFNRDVEERYWEHMLGAGFKPNFEVNSNMYEVSQEGLDFLATEAAQYTQYLEQERRSDPNSSYARNYESAARSYTEAVARVSRVTGLTPTVANAPFGGGAVQSLQAAAEPGQEWNPRFLAALSRGILGTTQHEFGHNAQGGHGEGFSSFLGAIHAVTQLPEILAITDRMVQELAESGGLRAMAADLEQHSRIISTENIFEKVSVSEEIPDAERWADWPVDPRTPPTDREAVGGVEPLAGPLYRGGEAGRGQLPGRVPGYGEEGRLQPSDAVYDRGAGGSEAANVVRPVPPVGGAVQGAGTTAGDLTNARLGRSPTLQAVAAESAATLQDTLEQALQDDPMFGLGPSVEDQRTMAGFARFYTSAILGLAANDAERLDTIGLTAQQAEAERQRALDLLATPERQTALYEAEAAWATLHGPSEPVADGPSAMAGQEPPSLADPFFSPLLMHAASLPDIMEGVQEVRRPSRPDTERVVRPAARNPNRDEPAPGSGLIMRDDGSWVRPAQDRPDVIAVAGQTPGQQALQMLNEAGAKADELAWTGLKDWLQKYEGPRLTRPEILDYLNNNQVRLEETVFGGPQGGTIEPEQVQVALIEHDDLEDENGELSPTRIYEVMTPGVSTRTPVLFRARQVDRNAWELYDDQNVMIDQYDNYQDIEEDLPAHGADVLTLRALPREGYRPVRHGQPDIQLPGGENYREIILTFPQKVTPNEQVRIEQTPRGFYQVAEYSAAGGFNGFVSAEYRERSQAVDAREKYLAENWESSGAQPTFRNPSHFGGLPNIVVWVRFNERTDADGKRVLFIEEIQSDWHQQGRKRGYLGDTTQSATQLRVAQDAEQARYSELREQGLSHAEILRDQSYRDLAEETRRVAASAHAESQGVPDAPWKATPAWTGLAFRRMVRWGAENGFERIAWTTGDQQNDRWSLARRISEVAYSGSDLRAWNHEGEEVVSETGVSRDRLPEYLGPELTERLLAQEPQGTLRRLTGQDLVVGGKPMRDYYDRILVEVAQELGEPWGVAPSTTTINAAPEDPMEQVPFGAVEGGTEVNSMDLPGTMARSAMEIGQPMFMAAQEPPSLEELRDAPAAMWYSNLSSLAADLDDEIEAIPEVRGPERTIPDRIARPANKNRQKQPPAPQSGLTMLEDGTWIKPGETIPGPVEQEGRTSAESAVAQLRVDGAKDAEIAWAHLDQWARDQGDRTVTRQEIQEHLAEHAITIEENVYGGEDVEVDVSVPPEREWDVVENEPEVMEEGYEDEDGEWVEPVYYGQDEEPEYTFQVRAGVRGSERWDWIYDVRGSHDNGWYVTDEDGKVVSDDIGSDMFDNLFNVERAIQADAEQLLDGAEAYLDTEGPAHWGPKSYPDYTLPGFDEYREIILRLPVAESPYRKIYAVQAGIEDVNRRMREFLGNRPRDEAIRENVNNMDWLRQYAELTMEHGRLIEEHGQATRLRDESQFSESHWSQPNVVLHVRFTTRTLPSGERLLFIEELQSDWQQKGRDQGFMPAQGLPEGYRLEWMPPAWLTPGMPIATGTNMDPDTGEYETNIVLQPGTQEYEDYVRSQSKLYVRNPDQPRLGPYENEEEAVAKARRSIRMETNRLPEMPFDRAQLWATLGMRRMIRYAAENGFDKIGWTQGSVHDRRYPDPSRSSEAFKNFYDGRLVKVADELGEPYGVQSGYDEIDTGEMTHPSVGHDGDQFAVADGNGEIQPERFPTYQEAHAHMMANYEALTAGGERIHVMDLPEEMQRETLAAPQPMFMAAGEPPDLSGEPPLWDSNEDDWRNEIDPEDWALRDEYAARAEMTDPSGLPRTDTPAEAAALTAPETILWDPEEDDIPADTAVLPDTPLLGPPDPSEPNLDQFPEWAQPALEMGSLMTDATRTLSASDRAEIRELVESGPQGTLLSEPEREVLIKTIEWQYQRLKRAADRRGPDGEMTPYRAAQLTEQARRYTALRALAATPRERWATLGDVWRSAPVSEGESGSLDEFMNQQREAARNGDANAEAELERAAVRRLAQQVDSSRPRMVGRRSRRATGQNVDADDRSQATEYGRGLQNAVDSPFASPNRVAASVADTDLNLHPLEILQGMRYNAMLIGARGILTDYVSNIGMLFGKMMADTVIFEAGGFNPLARGTIAMAVTAAQARAMPLAMRSWSQTVLTGLSDAQADVGGTPRTMTDKLETRIQDAKSEGARWYGRRRLELTGKKTAALGFVELAQRFKGAADEGIKLVAYTGAMTRQAATLAWKKNDHPLNSEAWHAQVAEMMQGNGLHDDPKMNLAMYQQWVRNATREAEDTVFQGPMGAIGRMMEPIQKHPLGQFVLPFLRTLYHIRGLAVDISPLGLPLAAGDVARAGVYRGLMKSERGQRFLGGTRNVGGLLGGPYAQAWNGADVGPGVRRLDHRMLAGAVGQVAFFYLVGLAFEGILSGVGPPDDPVVWLEEDKPNFERIGWRRSMEKEGWQRYSVKVNGQWISYQNWGPLAYLMASAAAIGEAYRYGVPADRRRSHADRSAFGPLAGFEGTMDLLMQGDQDTFKSAGRRFYGVLRDVSFLGGLIDLFEITEKIGEVTRLRGGPKGESPGERIQRERRAWASINRYTTDIATTFLPVGAALRAGAASQDPYQRATEYGDFSEGMALMVPERGGPIPPDIAPPWSLSDFFADPLGSTTGRRQGLPILHDIIGEPVANPYQGWLAIAPWRARPEDLSSPTARALIEAEMGPPSAPSEVYIRPIVPSTDKQGRAMMVLLPPSERQKIAVDMGHRIDARVQQELAAVPQAQREADPDAWKDRLGKAMLEERNAASNAYRDVPANMALLNQLRKDLDRVRWYESKLDKELFAPGEAPADDEGMEDGETPDLTPPTATPRPSATPRPGPTPTPPPGGTRVPTPRPTPSAPAPRATPILPVPGQKSQQEIDRERQKGTPVPAGR